MTKLNDILQIGNEILTKKTTKGATIYNEIVYAECVGIEKDKLKKKVRQQLRNKLKNFLTDFLINERKPEKLNSLFEAFNKYASIIYVDKFNVIDNNSKNTDLLEICNRFMIAFKKYCDKNETTKKPTVKKVVVKKTVDKKETVNNNTEIK